MDKNRTECILEYIEAIYRFALSKLSSRQDAEDLAQEILLHVLNGLGRYRINNLDAWVWRIAHNRYARLIEKKCASRECVTPDGGLPGAIDDYTVIDRLELEEEHRHVFEALHTLSSIYRDIFVDHYVNGLTISEIAKKRNVSESCAKWRLHTGRNHIRERMTDRMGRVYERINWNTTTCNGSFNPNRYLFSQLARAICSTVYETPLTISEISIATGVPAMYVEDEIERLLHGEAVSQNGSRYQTNFIILKKRDKNTLDPYMVKASNDMAEKFKSVLLENSINIEGMDFHGSRFGTSKLGYIIIPLVLRAVVGKIDTHGCISGYDAFPPRKDGGYGWFHVSETQNDDDSFDEDAAGMNIIYDRINRDKGCFCYLWMGKIFDDRLYDGIKWLYDRNIIKDMQNGRIKEGVLSDEELARLVSCGLAEMCNKDLELTFPVFRGHQYDHFMRLFDEITQELSPIMEGLIKDIRGQFQIFVPRHLHNQIDQYVAGYINGVSSLLIDELQKDDVLIPPRAGVPMTHSMFYSEAYLGLNGKTI